ncbi:hypothetical protein BT69DRAFT_346245 [Atractiella rhizophila]|nr:hypothetical protein BT69DRAFT_346245 [Atractiella rhizophila]
MLVRRLEALGETTSSMETWRAEGRKGCSRPVKTMIGIGEEVMRKRFLNRHPLSLIPTLLPLFFKDIRSTGMIPFPVPSRAMPREAFKEYSIKHDMREMNLRLSSIQSKQGKGYDVVDWENAMSERIYSHHYSELFLSIANSAMNEMHTLSPKVQSHLPDRHRFKNDLGALFTAWKVNSGMPLMLSERFDWDCEMDRQTHAQLEREVPLMKEHLKTLEDEEWGGLPVGGSGSRMQVSKWTRDAEAELDAVRKRIEGGGGGNKGAGTTLEMAGFTARKAL